jgi:branched-chain amino acid transport system ATP-binding protein
VTALHTANGHRAAAAEDDPALEIRGLRAGYGRVMVIRDLDLTVAPGTVTALLGRNGAGKTTLMRAVSGTIGADAGSICVGGVDVTRMSSSRRVGAALCLIPEGRGVFKGLSVRENLQLFSPRGANRAELASGTAEAMQLFPRLGQRLSQLAGSMSGGEQQMLALSRAFIARPKMVLLDELSMGLAPHLTEQIFAALRSLAASGAALLLVEQYVDQALAMADAVVIMNRGESVFAGRPDELDRDRLVHSYLGGGSGSRPNAE